MKLYPVALILTTMALVGRSSAQGKDDSVEKSAAGGPLPTEATISTIEASWTWANPVFQNGYTGYAGYYDVFKIVASVADNYRFSSRSSIATMAFLYSPTFNATSPQQNLVTYGYPSGTTQQFDFTSYLQSDTSYDLVVTSYQYLQIGEASINATGAAEVVFQRMTVLEQLMPNITFQSNFTNFLPQVVDVCGSIIPYDIYSIVPNADGDFVIEYVSDYGANIRLYIPPFDPLASALNVIASYSSGSRTRTLLNVTLSASTQYYLVISSNQFYYYNYYANTYRVTFRGSSQFTMTKTTGTSVSTAGVSSSLTKKSQKYSRGMSIDYVYYYKVFRISVQQSGIYSVLGYSGIGLTSYLYDTSFSPLFFSQNMVSTTSGSDGQASFVSRSKLSADKDYYLVVTTSNEETTGAFNLTVIGPRATSISAIPDLQRSNITVSVSLTSASNRFARCQAYYGNYYYNLFNITVPSSGLYTVKSQGWIDTFGCLYTNQFDRNAPQANSLIYDDQSGGNDQFAITTILKKNTIYYLAASTVREYRLGTYKVAVSGPAKASIRLVKNG